MVVGQSIVLTYAPAQAAGSTCAGGELIGVWSTSAAQTVGVLGGPVGFTGTVTGVSAGTGTISVDLLGRTATRTITVTPAPVASVQVTPANATLLVGATQQMSAVCLAASGQPTTPCNPVWSMATNSAATISASGVVTGVAPGPATAVATSGAVSGQTTVTVTAAPAAARIAYGMVDQNGNAVSAYDYSSLGGPLTSVRTGLGSYAVTLPGFGGASGESRLPLAFAVSSQSTVCVAVSWNMIGVTDATVNVRCSDHTGGDADSDFVVFAAGQGGLPGAFAFGYSGPVASMPVAGTTATLGSAAAWSSAGPVRFARDGITPNGRYLLTLGLPAGPATAYAVVQAPAGAVNSRCTVASWSFALDVVCYPPGNSSFGNAPFAGLLLDQGRTGMRVASAWANQPSAANYAAPVLARRNSSGGAITITRSAVGTYQLVFAGLGRPAAARREMVLVTTQALFSPASCRVSTPWSSSVAADLSVSVNCVNSAGVRSDESFFVVVLE